MLVLEFVSHGDLLTYLRAIRKRVSLSPNTSLCHACPNKHLCYVHTQAAAQYFTTGNEEDAAPYLEPSGTYSHLKPKDEDYDELGTLDERNLVDFARQIAAGMVCGGGGGVKIGGLASLCTVWGHFLWQARSSVDGCGGLLFAVFKGCSLSLNTKYLLVFRSELSLSSQEYLCSLGIVHRDLACRNILVGEGKTLKVSDFGMSRLLPPDEVYVPTSHGLLPLRWMAIEALFYRHFTTKTDVWSYGVVLWEICTMGN